MLALLAESSVRITLVIAIAVIALQAFRIWTAVFRHVIWAAVMAAMLLMPMIVAWAPNIWLRVLPESPLRSPIVIEMSPAPAAIDSTQSPVSADAPASSSFSISWQTALVSVYGLGVAFLLFRLAVGTLQVLRLLATSSFDRGHRVHSACSTPITVGWRKPVVILPSSWSEWPAERLQAVMAHEEQHLRRRDPLIQWLALLNRAIFWFHPLAWWLERELARLAEQACDEGVLAQGVEAEDYSNALVFLARAAHETGTRIQLGTTMPGPALYGRLRAILDGPHPQPVSAWRLTGLILTISTGMFLFSTSNFAQEQPKLAYDVATVKPAAPGSPGRMLRLSGPGQVSIKNFMLKDLIQWAYSSGTLTISGGPKWMDSQSPNDSFDIEAKGPADATLTQLRQMMRTLLAERFQMRVHTEQKEVAAYALIPARSDRKLGPNIMESTGKPCGDGPSAPPDSGMPRCRSGIGPQSLTMEGATMKQLADLLSVPITDLGRPVVDRTGIPGDFKINLDFTFRTMPNGPRTGEEGPSLFTALQEQLGLKLENAKASIEVLVIDSADRPTEN